MKPVFLLFLDEEGSKFYVILRGSVSVHIRVALPTEGGGQIMGTRKVNELFSGQSFGELAIMDEAIKPRSATITCMEDSDFATLDRKSYQRLIGFVQKQQVMAQVEFLQGISIFRHFSEHVLKVWVYLFGRKVTLPYKARIYREKDAPDEVFVVRSGQVVVTKKVPVAIQREDRTIVTMAKDKVLALDEKPPIMREIKIALLGPGEIFGDEEGFAEFMQTQDRDEKEGGETENKEQGEEKPEEKPEKSKTQSVGHKRIINLDRHTEEAQILENIKCYREATVSVSSREAEIWAIPTKVEK